MRGPRATVPPSTAPREPSTVGRARVEADRLEAAVADPGRRRRCLVALVERFERTGAAEAALLCLERVRPLCPLPDDEAHVQLWQGRILKRSGEVERALEALERGLALPHPSREREDEEVRYFLHYEAANCLYRLGRLDAAEARCREAIRLEPRLPQGWTGLGAILKAQGKRGDAAACFVASAILFPDDSEAARGLEAVVREDPLLPLAFPALARGLERVREGFRFPRTSDATH